MSDGAKFAWIFAAFASGLCLILIYIFILAVAVPNIFEEIIALGDWSHITPRTDKFTILEHGFLHF